MERCCVQERGPISCLPLLTCLTITARKWIANLSSDRTHEMDCCMLTARDWIRTHHVGHSKHVLPARPSYGHFPRIEAIEAEHVDAKEVRSDALAMKRAREDD